eukprot:3761797-Rhodomonas_salina.3
MQQVFPTEGDGMDAEDMRFHAIRRAVMDRSAKQKKARYRRAQSERGSVSQVRSTAKPWPTFMNSSFPIFIVTYL